MANVSCVPAVVQDCGVAAIRAQRDGGRKAVGAADSAGRRYGQALAGGQINGRIFGFAFLRGWLANLCSQKKGEENSAGKSNHGGLRRN